MYRLFGFIQAIKNEKSGNAYTRISDWLKQKLSDLEQSTREKTFEEVREKIEKFWIDPRKIDNERITEYHAHNDLYNDINNLLTSLQRNDSEASLKE